MQNNLLYEIPVFGKFYSRHEVYFGLIKDRNIFKYYKCHRNYIINYVEFENLNDALIYLFNSLKKYDEVSDFDRAYEYVVNYFNLNKNLKLKK